MGSGSSGLVLKARKDNQLFAIKAFLCDKDENASQMFIKESKILQSLKHPGIPEWRESFTLNNVHYLVQDFVDGYPFSYLLCNGQIFSEQDVKTILIRLLELLVYLHEPGPSKEAVIYRDLRLSNLILNENNLFLIDFGLAEFYYPEPVDNTSNISYSIRVPAPKKEIPNLGTNPGAFTYRLLREEVSPQSDIFGTGIVAIDLLSSLIKDENLFKEPWQKVIPVSETFKNFLEKLLMREGGFRTAQQALNFLKILC